MKKKIVFTSFYRFCQSIISAESEQKRPSPLEFIETLLSESDYQTDFDVMAGLSINFVENERLELIHKVSGISCWIEFASDFNMAESSQIIKKCIDFDPLCKYFEFGRSSSLHSLLFLSPMKNDYFSNQNIILVRLLFDSLCSLITKCCEQSRQKKRVGGIRV